MHIYTIYIHIIYTIYTVYIICHMNTISIICKTVLILFILCIY